MGLPFHLCCFAGTMQGQAAHSSQAKFPIAALDYAMSKLHSCWQVLLSCLIKLREDIIWKMSKKTYVWGDHFILRQT